MKDAYSPIFQEYLTALQVGYHQMAELQVVCPCCREAVFRAEREFANGPTAYFSHYRASAGLTIAECERRVAAISSADKNRVNQESRNQSLSVFRGVLREAVSPIPVKGRLLPEKDLSWMEKPFELNITVALVRNYVMSWSRETLRNLTFRNSQRMLGLRGLEVSPTARPSIRSSIAADLVLTVFKDNAHRTATYLVARSMRDCFHKDPLTRESVIHGRARTLEVANWNNLKDRSDRDTLVPVLVIMDFVLRELERLPFEKMILNARNGLRPMQGITIEDYLPKEDYPEFQYALRRINRERVASFDASFETTDGSFRTPGDSLYIGHDDHDDEQQDDHIQGFAPR
ncbi:hypothetical protein G6L37_34735 [Agrobacterium rubi]|nr:hypothetical protein [Agrobacterium rubi]NTF23725.1 hypothetical protein [Agrobacterium rubi]